MLPAAEKGRDTDIRSLTPPRLKRISFSPRFRKFQRTRKRVCAIACSSFFAAEELAEAIAALDVPARQTLERTSRSHFRRNPCTDFHSQGH
jgi:hypothetical protein